MQERFKISKESESRATKEEMDGYHGLKGELIRLGGGILRQAAFTASYLQQKLGLLKVCNIHEANVMLKELGRLQPAVFFRPPPQPIRDTYLETFSNGSFNICKAQNYYGQTGFIPGLCIVKER
ncbi:unnamed protein product [Agarophyton chilense]